MIIKGFLKSFGIDNRESGIYEEKGKIIAICECGQTITFFKEDEDEKNNKNNDVNASHNFFGKSRIRQ